MTAPVGRGRVRRPVGPRLQQTSRAALASLPGLLSILSLLSLLSACAACAPAPKVELMPVSAPCITTRPTAPSLPAVPSHGIFGQAQALLAREQLRAAYARQLEMLLDACAGG